MLDARIGVEASKSGCVILNCHIVLFAFNRGIAVNHHRDQVVGVGCCETQLLAIIECITPSSNVVRSLWCEVLALHPVVVGSG